MTILTALALGSFLGVASCNRTSEPAGQVEERTGGVTPAARGAIGAYARSGKTPWTDRDVRGFDEPDMGGTAPGPPSVPSTQTRQDGGVAL